MGEFSRSSSGRPEGTSVTKQGVVHYTCNPPSNAAAERNGIVGIGAAFGVGLLEVLLMPIRLFTNRGVKPDTTTAENILREIDE